MGKPDERKEALVMVQNLLEDEVLDVFRGVDAEGERKPTRLDLDTGYTYAILEFPDDDDRPDPTTLQKIAEAGKKSLKKSKERVRRLVERWEKDIQKAGPLPEKKKRVAHEKAMGKLNEAVEDLVEDAAEKAMLAMKKTYRKVCKKIYDARKLRWQKGQRRGVLAFKCTLSAVELGASSGAAITAWVKLARNGVKLFSDIYHGCRHLQLQLDDVQYAVEKAIKTWEKEKKKQGATQATFMAFLGQDPLKDAKSTLKYCKEKHTEVTGKVHKLSGDLEKMLDTKKVANDRFVDRIPGFNRKFKDYEAQVASTLDIITDLNQELEAAKTAIDGASDTLKRLSNEKEMADLAKLAKKSKTSASLAKKLGKLAKEHSETLLNMVELLV